MNTTPREVLQSTAAFLDQLDNYSRTLPWQLIETMKRVRGEITSAIALDIDEERALHLAQESGEPYAVVLADVRDVRRRQVVRLGWLDDDAAQAMCPVTLAIVNPNGEIER